MTDDGLESRVKALEDKVAVLRDKAPTYTARVCRAGTSKCIYITKVAGLQHINEGDYVEYTIRKKEDGL